MLTRVLSATHKHEGGGWADRNALDVCETRSIGGDPRDGTPFQHVQPTDGREHRFLRAVTRSTVRSTGVGACGTRPHGGYARGLRQRLTLRGVASRLART